MKNKKYKVKIPEGYKFVTQEVKCDGDEMRVSKVYRKKEKELPKTWEEFHNRKHDNWKGQIEVTGPKHDEFTALWKIVLLRDHYNDGSAGFRCSIYRNDLNDIVFEECSVRGPLNFNTVDLGKQFLSNFAQLIETAKPLL